MQNRKQKTENAKAQRRKDAKGKQEKVKTREGEKEGMGEGGEGRCAFHSHCCIPCDSVGLKTP